MTKTLVAYFSATGMTAGVAKKLAKVAGADMFEITPEHPYTSADLDWQDKQSRTTLEMQDKTCRPKIVGQVDQMAQYDQVFVGFPIWWYREPSIIDTFIQSYDFSGKTVIPFATSGGSGMGTVAQNIQTLAPGADVKTGERLDDNVSEDHLKKWLDKGF